MRLTDMADELYAAAADLPGGVRTATARRGGVTVTRVEIAREGLEKPRGAVRHAGSAQRQRAG